MKGKEKKTKASTVNDAVATNLQEGEVSLPDKALQEINSSSLIQSESGIVEVTKNPNNDANNKAPALSASELKAVNDLRQESESGHPEITLTKDEASLLALNDGMVVLQWAGLSRLNMAKAYKKKHPLSDRMSIYRRMSGDRLLYIIISDRFSSRDLANIAMGEYEKRGIGGEPWVKTAAAVKKDINLFIEFFI